MAADVPQEEEPDAGLEEAEPDAPSPGDCSVARQVVDSPVALGQADYSAASRAGGSELPQDDSLAAGEPDGWRVVPELARAWSVVPVREPRAVHLREADFPDDSLPGRVVPV